MKLLNQNIVLLKTYKSGSAPLISLLTFFGLSASKTF